MLAVAPAAADTVTCADGIRYTGVITGETPTHVMLKVGGAEVFLARSAITSVVKSTPEDNRALSASWDRLNTRFKDESAQAERESPPPTPPPQPTAAPAVDPDDVPLDIPEDEPEEQYAAAPEPPPTPDNPVDQRLAKEREMRAQIYRKNVVPGMTARQVRSAWGYPDLMHPVHGVYEYTDRWIYNRPGGRAVVYFKDGEVTSVNENVGILGY